MEKNLNVGNTNNNKYAFYVYSKDKLKELRREMEDLNTKIKELKCYDKDLSWFKDEDNYEKNNVLSELKFLDQRIEVLNNLYNGCTVYTLSTGIRDKSTIISMKRLFSAKINGVQNCYCIEDNKEFESDGINWLSKDSLLGNVLLYKYKGDSFNFQNIPGYKTVEIIEVY